MRRKSTTRASLLNIFCYHFLKRRKDAWCLTRKDQLAVKTASYKSLSLELSKTIREAGNLPSKAWKLASIDYHNLECLELHQLRLWTVSKIWKRVSMWMLVARRSKRLVSTDTNLSQILKKWTKWGRQTKQKLWIQEEVHSRSTITSIVDAVLKTKKAWRVWKTPKKLTFYPEIWIKTTAKQNWLSVIAERACKASQVIKRHSVQNWLILNYSICSTWNKCRKSWFSPVLLPGM
jgi:hypothetical protein